MLKFLQKLYRIKDLENNRNKNILKFLTLVVLMQCRVVLVTAETAINMVNVENFFSDKNIAFCAKKLLSASKSACH